MKLFLYISGFPLTYNIISNTNNVLQSSVKTFLYILLGLELTITSTIAARKFPDYTFSCDYVLINENSIFI